MNKEEAIQAATDHANKVHPDWSEQAYQKSLLCLTSFNQRGVIEFQICDLRKAIDTLFIPLPEPPTMRSWGGVARQLVKNKKIKLIGYSQTNNRKAHNAVAAVYKTI